MPNNPGRIDGDYSIGEKEEVKYVDPGNFGAMRSESHPGKIRLYAVVLGVLVVILITILALAVV